jgi:hypothetical protein
MRAGGRGSEAVQPSPCKRSRQAVAVKARPSSRGREGEAVEPWP